MRRSPFYAYAPGRYPPFQQYPSHFDHRFPAQQGYLRPSSYNDPHPPSSSSSSSAPRRSVIHVPVQDSARPIPSSSSSSSSPQLPQTQPVTQLDPTQAALRIQSRFRGFAVRRRSPIINLRSILGVRKELKQLEAELESPEFASKIRGSDKERLRFSESVMALILRLDAIEGSLPEVRSQRKEVTKMALRLQDAVDAIMMQPDDALAASTASNGTLNSGHEANCVESGEAARIIELEGTQQQTQEAQPTVVNKESHVLIGDSQVMANCDKFGAVPESVGHDEVADASLMSLDTMHESLSTGDSHSTSLADEAAAGEDIIISAVCEEDTVLEAGNVSDHEDALMVAARDVSEHDEEVESVDPDPGAKLIETRNESDQEESGAHGDGRSTSPVDEAAAGEDIITSTVCGEDKGPEAGNESDHEDALMMVTTRDASEHGEEVGSADPGAKPIEARNESDQEESRAHVCSQTAPPAAPGTMDVDAHGSQAEQDAACMGISAHNELSPEAVERSCPLKEIHASNVQEVHNSPVAESSSTASISDLVNERDSEMLLDPCTKLPLVPDIVKTLPQFNCIVQPCGPMMDGECTIELMKDSNSLRERCQGNEEHGCRIERGYPRSFGSMDAESPMPDRLFLKQLSDDCKQLKSLLGKLLVQSRAQSKVISAGTTAATTGQQQPA